MSCVTTMILELDIGNSRIKWRLRESAGAGVLSKGVVKDLDELKKRFATQRIISSVWVASVREAEFMDRLSDWVKQRWTTEPEVAQVKRKCHGLTIAYQDLSRLGVDRWLAMLAAFKDAGSDCIVVDCGTALTVDVIDVDGKHRGGYIVPGIQLAAKALVDNTGIQLDDPDPGSALAPGNSTDESVRNGALLMLVALIEKTIEREIDYKDTSNEFKIYLTGGDADTVAQFLKLPPGEFKIIPGLVFDGLSLALSDS